MVCLFHFVIFSSLDYAVLTYKEAMVSSQLQNPITYLISKASALYLLISYKEIIPKWAGKCLPNFLKEQSFSLPPSELDTIMSSCYCNTFCDRRVLQSRMATFEHLKVWFFVFNFLFLLKSSFWILNRIQINAFRGSRKSEMVFRRAELL